jgi:hypothetical protein
VAVPIGSPVIDVMVGNKDAIRPDHDPIAHASQIVLPGSPGSLCLLVHQAHPVRGLAPSQPNTDGDVLADIPGYVVVHPEIGDFEVAVGTTILFGVAAISRYRIGLPQEVLDGSVGIFGLAVGPFPHLVGSQRHDLPGTHRDLADSSLDSQATVHGHDADCLGNGGWGSDQ